MQNLKVGSGFNYQSRVYLNAQNLQETPAYTSVDMLLGYNFNKVWLALNANNLTDKKFYSQVNGGRVVPAAGRNFIASLQYSF
jgi:outer membrane receptor for ferric coprogen and ferric-rhodotorulic acid